MTRAAKDYPAGVFALAGAAQQSAGLIERLMTDSRKRGVTVQWVPQDPGCRFEAIRVRDGQLLYSVHVRPDGTLRET